LCHKAFAQLIDDPLVAAVFDDFHAFLVLINAFHTPASYHFITDANAAFGRTFSFFEILSHIAKRLSFNFINEQQFLLVKFEKIK
jgi:hypothetical protein